MDSQSNSFRPSPGVIGTTVFVISQDAAIRDSLAELVASSGLCTETFSSIEAWLKAGAQERRGCMVLDAPARDFTDVEDEAIFVATCAARPVLVLVDRGDVALAVRVIKDGAVDVLEKPFGQDKLLSSVERAMVANRSANTSEPSISRSRT